MPKYPDSLIRSILGAKPHIAMVGASTNWNRPSFFAMKYLLIKGFRVTPVNPRSAGETLLGQKVVATLEQVPKPCTLVDLFRPSQEMPRWVDEIIALAPDKGFEVVWMQLGVKHAQAAAKAQNAGLCVIQDRCPKIEVARLSGELSWGGFDSRVVSARRGSLEGFWHETADTSIGTADRSMGPRGKI